MLFDAGVDIKSAQRFLGHADVEITLSIYTHLTKYKEEQAIQVLDKHLNERNNEMQKPLLRVL
jgi:site-specific recombinase XerD